jgi:hypothetical protein
LISFEGFSLYIGSILIGSVAIVEYDDGELVEKYSDELASAVVGFLVAGFTSGIVRILMGSRSYRQFVDQSLLPYVLILYIIGISVSAVLNTRLS